MNRSLVYRTRQPGRCSMAAKPFASSADLGVKEQSLEVLADGVYALTAEGDPNLGAIEGRPNPRPHRGGGLPRLFRAARPPRRPPPLAGQAPRAHRQAGPLPGPV